MVTLLLKLACIVFLIVALVCIWKTAEVFNELSDKDSLKPILSWDLLVIGVVFIALIMRLVSL
jgi:hypothetical protein